MAVAELMTTTCTAVSDLKAVSALLDKSTSSSFAQHYPVNPLSLHHSMPEEEIEESDGDESMGEPEQPLHITSDATNINNNQDDAATAVNAAVPPQPVEQENIQQTDHEDDSALSGETTMDAKERALNTKEKRKQFRVLRLTKGQDPRTVRTMSSIIVAVDGKSWYCGFCRQHFVKQSKLRSHVKSFHNGHRYRCDLGCGFSARLVHQVAQHKMQRHGVVTETFERHACSLCPYATVLRKNLAYHKKMRHDAVTAPVTTCQVKLLSRSTFEKIYF